MKSPGVTSIPTPELVPIVTPVRVLAYKLSTSAEEKKPVPPTPSPRMAFAVLATVVVVLTDLADVLPKTKEPVVLHLLELVFAVPQNSLFLGLHNKI